MHILKPILTENWRHVFYIVLIYTLLVCLEVNLHGRVNCGCSLHSIDPWDGLRQKLYNPFAGGRYNGGWADQWWPGLGWQVIPSSSNRGCWMMLSPSSRLELPIAGQWSAICKVVHHGHNSIQTYSTTKPLF